MITDFSDMWPVCGIDIDHRNVSPGEIQRFHRGHLLPK
jgi:hypothetical protein